MTCPITGNAYVKHDEETLRWLAVDSEIHIAIEVLEKMDDRVRAFVEAMYEVGEPLPAPSRMSARPAAGEDHGMTHEEWMAARERAEALVDKPVLVTLVNDHAVSGILTGVGYAGLRILPPDTDREVHYEYRLIFRVEAQR